jgi:hypothetical protein
MWISVVTTSLQLQKGLLRMHQNVVICAQVTHRVLLGLYKQPSNAAVQAIAAI